MELHSMKRRESFGFTLEDFKPMYLKLKQCPNSCISDWIGIKVSAKKRDNKFNHPLSKSDILKIETMLNTQKIMIPLIIMNIIAFVIFLITIKLPQFPTSDIAFNISFVSFLLSVIIHVPIAILQYINGWFFDSFNIYFDEKTKEWYPYSYDAGL